MFRSFEIFRVMGIPVRVHSTLLLFLLIAGILFSPGGGLAGVLMTLLFLGMVFSFVLLHELGHAVVAKLNGVGVRQITLHPLGGLASLVSMPRDPRKELAITIAGPAVNFVLAGLFFLLWLAVPLDLVRLLITVNLVLGLFNLLPGFPMDGGRILRALLATRLPYLKATRIAVRTGQVVAVLMGIAGLLMAHVILVLLAVFVWFTAKAELLAVTMTDADPYGDPYGGARRGVRVINPTRSW